MKFCGTDEYCGDGIIVVSDSCNGCIGIGNGGLFNPPIERLRIMLLDDDLRILIGGDEYGCCNCCCLDDWFNGGDIDFDEDDEDEDEVRIFDDDDDILK